jgi:hypothetical protein
MRVGEILQFCKLPEEGQSLMRAAMSQLNLSARAYHRILKLARTIADLAGSEEIQSVHLAEALRYRPKLINAQLTLDRQQGNDGYIASIFRPYLQSDIRSMILRFPSRSGYPSE